MKINFTKKEYKALVEMLGVADWVMHSFEETDNKTVHKVLRKKVLAYYKEMGLADSFTYDKAKDEYFETKDFEDESLNNYIHPYDTQTFWATLAAELAKRDLMTQKDQVAYQKTTLKERIEQHFGLSSWYEKEFLHHGLARLCINDEVSQDKRVLH